MELQHQPRRGESGGASLVGAQREFFWADIVYLQIIIVICACPLRPKSMC